MKFSLFSETFKLNRVGLLGSGEAEDLAGVGGGGRGDQDALRGGEEEPEQDRGGRGAAGGGGPEAAVPGQVGGEGENDGGAEGKRE